MANAGEDVDDVGGIFGFALLVLTFDGVDLLLLFLWWTEGGEGILMQLEANLKEIIQLSELNEKKLLTKFEITTSGYIL